MKNDIVGIIDVDYPEMTSDDRRSLQLGELTEMPDGRSVADYIAEVELLKEIALAEADAQREEDLITLAPEPTKPAKAKTKKKKEEETGTADDGPDEGIEPFYLPADGDEDPLI